MKIQKALSQEEMTIISNIKSLINELTSASSAGAQMSKGKGEDMETAPEKENDLSIEKNGQGFGGGQEGEDEDKEKMAKAKAKEDEDKAKEKVAKDQTKTEPDANSASDDAEARLIETISEVNEENIEEVKKAIKKMKGIVAQTQVAKSVLSSPVASALADLTVVVKALMQNQNQVENTLSGLLQGMGITEQLKAVEKSEALSGRRPVDTGNDDMMKVLKSMVDQLSSVRKDEKKVGSNGEIVRKNLSDPDVMTALFTKKA